MAGSDSQGDLASMLKPFHDRAKLAEERLEKLEAALDSKKDSTPSSNSGILESLLELKAKLEESRVEQLAERVKAAKALETVAAEKEKLRYQILHLKRSLQEADEKLLQAGARKS